MIRPTAVTALVLVLAAPGYASSLPFPKFGLGKDRPAATAAAAKSKAGEWAQARSDVGAQSIVNVSGGGRSASGVSTAVGNTATYYVSRPSGQ